jgi:hypothetical protein
MADPDIAIITSIYDGYDSLKPVLPQEGANVDWVFVTDQLPKDDLGWRVLHRTCFGTHPRRAAKWPKTFPWKYTKAPASIWIDGSFQVTSPRFAVEALEFANPIAQFKHPWRGCLFDEAKTVLAIGKYPEQQRLIKAQVAYYDELMDRDWGLWASGVIVRKHTPEVQRFGERWNTEMVLRSFHDQISEPYALYASGLLPENLPGTHFANPWLKFDGSKRH